MGADKSQLTFNGESLLTLSIRKLRSVAMRVIVVVDNSNRLSNVEVETCIDQFPDTGPLGGIVTGLQVLGDGSHLVVACDMPDLNTDILQLLIDNSSETWDAVVPTRNGHPEPLCALYRSSSLPALKAFLSNGGRSVQKSLTTFRTLYLDETAWGCYDLNANSFTNLNYPEELVDYINRDQIGRTNY